MNETEKNIYTERRGGGAKKEHTEYSP